MEIAVSADIGAHEMVGAQFLPIRIATRRRFEGTGDRWSPNTK